MNLKNLLEVKLLLPRPMLAGALQESQLNRLRFPLIASPKIDGYRAIAYHGVAISRSGKHHPCLAIQDAFKTLREFTEGLDGELTIPNMDFNTAGGFLRRADYTGAFRFSIFDIAGALGNLPFANRLEILKGLAEDLPPWAKILRQEWIENIEQLLAFESECLELGYEGICLRSPSSPYKHGRGTFRDQTLLKLKRFSTAEAKILRALPRMENLNPLERSPLGYAERSSNAENLVPTDILGAFEVVGVNGVYKDVPFSIGTFLGLDETDKRRLLREPPIGKICTYKFFQHDAKDAPRHPVFIGFRPDFDQDQGDAND